MHPGQVTIHVLRVTASTQGAEVWRRLHVDSAMTLADLDRALRIVLDLGTRSAHYFEFAGLHYRRPRVSGTGAVNGLDERFAEVAFVLPDVGAQGRYGQDDRRTAGGRHLPDEPRRREWSIHVEQIRPPLPGQLYPVCPEGYDDTLPAAGPLPTAALAALNIRLARRGRIPDRPPGTAGTDRDPLFHNIFPVLNAVATGSLPMAWEDEPLAFVDPLPMLRAPHTTTGGTDGDTSPAETGLIDGTDAVAIGARLRTSPLTCRRPAEASTSQGRPFPSPADILPLLLYLSPEKGTSTALLALAAAGVVDPATGSPRQAALDRSALGRGPLTDLADLLELPSTPAHLTTSLAPWTDLGAVRTGGPGVDVVEQVACAREALERAAQTQGWERGFAITLPAEGFGARDPGQGVQVTGFGRYLLARVLRGHGFTVPVAGILPRAAAGDVLALVADLRPADAAEEVRSWLASRGGGVSEVTNGMLAPAREPGPGGVAVRASIPTLVAALVAGEALDEQDHPGGPAWREVLADRWLRSPVRVGLELAGILERAPLSDHLWMMVDGLWLRLGTETDEDRQSELQELADLELLRAKGGLEAAVGLDHPMTRPALELLCSVMADRRLGRDLRAALDAAPH